MKIRVQGVNLYIGDNTFIGDESMIMGGKSNIYIGKNCDISSHVSIISGNHKICNIDKAAGDGYSEDITIEDGVWIGFGAILFYTESQLAKAVLLQQDQS